jgi:chromosome segregation ATPase
MLTAEDVVRLFEADARARRRLAELLVSEPDVRLAVINAVLRDVATKSDLEALRREVLARVSALEARVSELSERVARLEGAFTQLAERIGDLDKRIDALDKRIDALDKRIDALERRMDYVVRVSWVLVASVLATLLAQLALALLHALGKI